MAAQPPSRRERVRVARERSAAGRARVSGWLGARGYTRVRRGRLMAGVLAGLARRSGVRPRVLRIAFLVSLLLPGPQLLAYLALWVLMPSEP